MNNNKGFFYLEIDGDVEKIADKSFPLTLLSSFRPEKDKTVIKVHAEGTYFQDTIYDMYAVLGSVTKLEWIEL